MNGPNVIIWLPVICGLILFLIPWRARMVSAIITILVAIIVFIQTVWLFWQHTGIVEWGLFAAGPGFLRNIPAEISPYFILNIDPLASLIILFISIFSLLISVYSSQYISHKKKLPGYYPYFLITVGSAMGAALSDHLITFLFFWGVLGLTLYKLVSGEDEESSSAAKKTLILIGASDSIMILGIGFIWLRTGSFLMSGISLMTNTFTANIAFVLLLVGSFTKAGAFPFHTWIPDYVGKAPASSSALLPASIDKLLGIYFMYRICVNIFVLNQWLVLTILSIGVITIISAVMMALIQHNYKRLLGYHAVSQVGYMLVGLGLCSPIGIAGGLFHMVNHALYKSGLFLSAGSIERQTGEDDLAGLGGLSKNMPVTFVSALIFALAISGIPPLNGFASKWLIYQGIIDFGQGSGIANRLWIVWLALAVFGSALTLASFIKFISGAFLGRSREKNSAVKEAGFFMWFPLIILAIICVGFGVFATGTVIPVLFKPITGEFSFPGFWNSTFVSSMILVSIIVGILIYMAGNLRNFRTSDSFIGGEKNREETNFSVLDFYRTIREMKLLSFFYRKADKKWFDIYDLSRSLVLGMNRDFSRAHSGLLTTYVFWILLGLVFMCILIM